MSTVVEGGGAPAVDGDPRGESRGHDDTEHRRPLGRARTSPPGVLPAVAFAREHLCLRGPGVDGALPRRQRDRAGRGYRAGQRSGARGRRRRVAGLRPGGGRPRWAGCGQRVGGDRGGRRGTGRRGARRARHRRPRPWHQPPPRPPAGYWRARRRGRFRRRHRPARAPGSWSTRTDCSSGRQTAPLRSDMSGTHQLPLEDAKMSTVTKSPARDEPATSAPAPSAMPWDRLAGGER